MFKLLLIASCLCSLASAGYIGAHDLVVPSYHGSYIKSYAAPIVAAPIVKHIAPVATSYSNTYKISTNSIPVVHAAPLLHAAPIVHAAPAVYAAPVHSTYHGNLAHYGYGHGYGYGYGHGHSLYH